MAPPRRHRDRGSSECRGRGPQRGSSPTRPTGRFGGAASLRVRVAATFRLCLVTYRPLSRIESRGFRELRRRFNRNSHATVLCMLRVNTKTNVSDIFTKVRDQCARFPNLRPLSRRRFALQESNIIFSSDVRGNDQPGKNPKFSLSPKSYRSVPKILFYCPESDGNNSFWPQS